jgi:carbon-monoxide dehydrogenase medium subunit
MTKGQVDRVRLVLGGVGPAPLVIEEADALLRRQPPSEYLLNQAAKAAMKKAEGGIADNLIAPAEYRRRMTAVMAKRALEMAVKSGGTL